MKELLSQTEETKQDGQDSAKSSKKERILEELKTEPLKYVLEIADVTNAQELLDKLSKSKLPEISVILLLLYLSLIN